MEISTDTKAYEAGVTPEFVLFLLGLFKDVKPKKVSHADGYFAAEHSGQYNLRTLDRMIETAFIDYALNPAFQVLANKDREIAFSMAGLKQFYLDEVVKYNVDPGLLSKAHLVPLRRILNPIYDEAEFLRKLSLVRKSLEETGQTALPREEGIHLPVYDETERVKAERLMLAERLFAQDAEKAQAKREKALELRARRLELEQRITEINPFNQNSMIFTREFPDIQTWMRNPESSAYIPRIMVSVSDYINQVILPETGEMLRNNLRTVFRNPNNSIYPEFIQQFDEMATLDTAKITDLIASGASIRKNKLAEFDVSEMTHSVVPWVAAYYRLNGKAVMAISDLRKKHVSSLVSLISRNYIQMLQSDERIVA